MATETSKSWLVWARLGSLVPLSACTAPNPAYEDGGIDGTPGPTSAGDASFGPGGSSSDGRPVETSAGGSSGGGSEATDEHGETSSSETETGSEDPPLPPIIGPYHEPLLETALSHPLYEDDDPTLTGDMLEIYFATVRPGGSGMDDIWFATRGSVDEPWSTPEPVHALNSDQRDQTPEISVDGLTMMLSSTRTSFTFSDEDMFMATRPSREAPWGEPMPVAEMTTPGRDVCAFITADGLGVYGCTGMGLALDIVRFERDAPGGAWSGPMVVEGLQSNGLDCGAWVDATETTIAFFSDRQGELGVTDLYVATREDVGGAFGMPVPIEELNSAWLDDDPWISQDGRVVYFASDRPGVEAQDIYVAVRR